MAGDYASERQYSERQRVAVVSLHLVRVGRITAKEAAAMVGCKLRNAYMILDDVAEILGLYKEEPFYIMMPK